MKKLLLLFTCAGLSAQTTPKKGLLTDLTPKKGAIHQTDPILYKKKTIEILDWKQTIETLPLELQDEIALLAILDQLKKVENNFLPQEQIKAIILLTFQFIKQHINEINWQALIDILFTSDFIYKVPFDQEKFYNHLVALLAKKSADSAYKKIYDYFKLKVENAEELTRKIRVAIYCTTPAGVLDLMRQGAFVLVPYNNSFLTNYIPPDEEYLTELTKLNISQQEMQKIFDHIIHFHSRSISHQLIDLYLKRGAIITRDTLQGTLNNNETLNVLLSFQPDKRIVQEWFEELKKLKKLKKQFPERYKYRNEGSDKTFVLLEDYLKKS